MAGKSSSPKKKHKKDTNWFKLKSQDIRKNAKYRDVYEEQQLDRGELGEKQTMLTRNIINGVLSVMVAGIVWCCWSGYEMGKGVLEAEALQKQQESQYQQMLAHKVTPDSTRDFTDLEYANMSLIPDDTYEDLGYAYRDINTDLYYTKGEYDIWSDVQHKIENKELHFKVFTADNGQKVYSERPDIADAPEEPRSFHDAVWANMNLVRGYLYEDKGYSYADTYTGNYYTEAEYQVWLSVQEKLKANPEYLEYEENYDDSGGVHRYYLVPEGESAVVSRFPSVFKYEREVITKNASAVIREMTPVEWMNLVLEKDNEFVSFGYAYIDKRTGRHFTEAEYAYRETIRQKVKNREDGYILFVEPYEPDNQVIFYETAPQAPDEIRWFLKQYVEDNWMKLHLQEASYWADYGWHYVDPDKGFYYTDKEYEKWKSVQDKRAAEEAEMDIQEPVVFTFSSYAGHVTGSKVLGTFVITAMFALILYEIFKRNLEAQNLLTDTSDINQYEGDQHIALPEEIMAHESFDWFPDVGAHAPVMISSMISHVMLTNKGLKNVELFQRYDKDQYDTSDKSLIAYEGEIVTDSDGNEIYEEVPMIDTKFSEALYTTSGAPREVWKFYDPSKIDYNGDGRSRNKIGKFKTVAQMINEKWTFPKYEPQRPAGAYIVDTDPVNTMV